MVWLVEFLTYSLASPNMRHVKLFVDNVTLDDISGHRFLKGRIHTIPGSQARLDTLSYLQNNQASDCTNPAKERLPLKTIDAEPIRFPQSLRTIHIDGQMLPVRLAVVICRCSVAGGGFRIAGGESKQSHAKNRLRIQWHGK